MLGRKEFEDELAHALFILRFKFKKFDSDRKRLNRANHGRIHFDVRLSSGSTQQKFYEGAFRKRRGRLQRTSSHRNIRHHSVHRRRL